MKGKISSLIFSCLLLILPLHAEGHLAPVDQALSSFFDSALSPLTPPMESLTGPMPRELALRRVVEKTEVLLRSEGRDIDHAELEEIARIVEKASIHYQIPTSLIFSVIHSESHFRRDAVSADGAMGLMQLQLQTAREFAQAAGLPIPTGIGLFDRETNITLGTGYLRYLIDRFGDLRTALAAYHVGPTEIGRRLNVGQPFSDEYGRTIRVREAYGTVPVPSRASVIRTSTAS